MAPQRAKTVARGYRKRSPSKRANKAEFTQPGVHVPGEESFVEFREETGHDAQSGSEDESVESDEESDEDESDEEFSCERQSFQRQSFEK